MANITFPELNPEDIATIADLIQKLKALDAELAKIQTERAQAEANWSSLENAIRAEQGKIEIAIRQIRSVVITKV